MIEIGTLLQERYLIEKQIGAGGMGAVYLAVDKRFDNHVAIKETFYKDEELGEAFEREARLLNALQHQVLPHVTDYFSENNGYFLVMQFIEGEDMSDILKREGAFPAADVVRWTESLLDALDYLHSQTPPIIHRDIKPHNLKITPRGDIMLLDFGLAKLNSDDTLGAISVFGYSRTYSPLEQIQGTGTDARSDIFALGATVYHLLTGKPPVDALARAAAIVNGKEDPLQLASDLNPEISVSVASVLNSALALNPENRFISAPAMRLALEHAVKEGTVVNFAENAGRPAETIPQVVPLATDAPVIDAAENENFPALEAFAASAEQDATETAMPNIVEIDSGAAVNSAPKIPQPEISEQKNSSSKPIIIETSRRTPPAVKPNQKTAVWAAAAAILLFGVIAAAFYFSRSDNPTEETLQTPVTETNTSVKANRKTADKVVPSTETVAESKTKQPTSTETAEKNADSDAPVVEKNEETPSENPVVESVRTTRSKAKTQASSTQEKQPQAVEEKSTTDAAEVESVFTGRETEANTTRNERRRRNERTIPDEMSEEEFEQLRREQRQRRRERRARRNNEPIPF